MSLNMPADADIPWFYLDYNSCTTTELRTFVQDRSALDIGVVPSLKGIGKTSLIARLRKMDRDATFPQFLDLPPELRNEVYRHALVDTGENHVQGNDMAAGLLLTPKLVHVEAEPILYSENQFYIELLTPHEGSLITEIVAPGVKAGFWYGHHYALSSGMLASDSFVPFGMLRNMRSLTIHLNNLDLGQSAHLPREANETLANVCLVLSGANKLKRVTFVIDADFVTRDELVLKRAFWPVALLRTDIALEFREGRQAKQLQTLIDKFRHAFQDPPFSALSSPGDLIHKAQETPRSLNKKYRQDFGFIDETDRLLQRICSSIVFGLYSQQEGFEATWQRLQIHIETSDTDHRRMQLKFETTWS